MKVRAIVEQEISLDDIAATLKNDPDQLARLIVAAFDRTKDDPLGQRPTSKEFGAALGNALAKVDRGIARNFFRAVDIARIGELD